MKGTGGNPPRVCLMLWWNAPLWVRWVGMQFTAEHSEAVVKSLPPTLQPPTQTPVLSFEGGGGNPPQGIMKHVDSGEMSLTLFQLKNICLTDRKSKISLRRDLGGNPPLVCSDAVVKCPPLSGVGGYAIHHRVFVTAVVKSPPPLHFNPQPFSPTPLLSLEVGRWQSTTGHYETVVKCPSPPEKSIPLSQSKK